MKPKIIALAGSLRKDSLNKKLARNLAEYATAYGAEVTFVDLADYPMPIFDGDIESEGFPENALKLKEIFMAHQGLIITSPEYNSSISGVLKNVIDWVSRPATKDEGSLACFQNKVALISSASPGALGGLRGLVHLRSILGNINVLVLPEQRALGGANQAFDSEGKIIDQTAKTAFEKMCAKLVDTVAKLHS